MCSFAFRPIALIPFPIQLASEIACIHRFKHADLGKPGKLHLRRMLGYRFNGSALSETRTLPARMNPNAITIDASHTAGSGKNTGIERVVRNLCRELRVVLPEHGLPQPETVTHFGGKFLSVDSPLQKRFSTLAAWEANATKFVPTWLQAIPNWLAQRSNSAKVKKWMTPHPSHLGIYKVPHHLYRWSSLLSRTMRGKPLIPSRNDILLLPDAYWTRRDIWDTVQTYRREGTFVATVVYDLIPLTHPEYVGKRRSEKFKRYLDQVVQHSDLIVAISKTVRDEVAAAIESRPDRNACCKDIRSFTLGAELTLPQESQGSIRNEVIETFSGPNPPYLMVASFDPRKNHSQALDAFDLLWKQDPELQLCFAGRTGAMCQELMDRIARHPMLGRRFFVYHDLSDAELHYAYQRCSGVLLPSIVEGFGLPIVESLWYGKKTFASDTPIHREVGGEHCEYFPLHDPQTLASLILSWQSQGKPSVAGPLVRYTPATWKQSATELVELLLDAYAEAHASTKNKSSERCAA